MIRWATGTFELSDNFALLAYLVLHIYDFRFYFCDALFKGTAIHGTSHSTDHASAKSPGIRLTDTMEHRPQFARSFRFDARELDHLRPLLGFLDDKLAKVGGRT